MSTQAMAADMSGKLWHWHICQRCSRSWECHVNHMATPESICPNCGPSNSTAAECTQQTVSIPSPRGRWINLRQYFLNEIERIDNGTPWKEVEPEWWLEMTAARRAVEDVTA